ncbi:MAG: hypothetical protein DRJ01_02100 [Bacteroidetes bacterium]|nr:MAG: hypothetical protein DRJ01_02100 [Bacteroidota bacterium]
MKNIQRDYRTARNFDIKDLSKNEAAYGQHRYYPDSIPVRNKLAEFKDIEKNEIIFTNGAEGAIKLIFDRFLNKRDWVVRPEPTFGMLDVFEQIKKVRVKKINYDLNKEINIIPELRRRHKLLYLANPDNPTGSYFNFKELRKILDKAKELKILVILDIVYLPYAEELTRDEFMSYETNLLTLYSNLFIVNSFSKGHGLAGERIGYIISQERNMKQLKMIAPLHPLTSTAIKNLEIILDKKELCILDKNQVNASRWHRIFEKEFPNHYQKTFTNFINLMVYDFYKRLECVKRLEDINIKVRTYEEPISMNSTLRISIGPDMVMRKVLKVIKGIKLT